MKILMLGWELPPHNSGGLGVACWQLCKELSKNSLSIKFLIPYKADHSNEFMDIVSVSDLGPGDVWTVYDDVISGNKVKKNLKDIFELEQHYMDAVGEHLDDDITVIHAHDWITFRAGLKAASISGKKLIAHVHSIESDRAGNSKGHPLIHEIEELGLQNADHIVAVSEFTKQKIVEEYKILPSKITVAHNGIDKDSLVELEGENSYSYLRNMQENGYKVVCNVGRLTVQKGLYNFLHAAEKVVRVEPKTLFLIVGSGDQENELIELSTDLGIGKNVIFTGFQRGKAWRDAFDVADLFVLPSVAEPFGLSALEAVAYGTPTLISKQSGVREVLRNALTVDSWDVDKMANDMIAAVRYQPLRDEMINNASKEFEHLDWSRSAQKLIDLYKTHSVMEAV